MDRLQIAINDLISSSLVTGYQADRIERDINIRNEYNELINKDINKMDIYCQLSLKHCISERQVIRIVSNKK